MSHKLKKALSTSRWLLWATVGSNIKDDQDFHFTIRCGMPVLRIEENYFTENVKGSEIKKFLK